MWLFIFLILIMIMCDDTRAREINKKITLWVINDCVMCVNFVQMWEMRHARRQRPHVRNTETETGKFFMVQFECKKCFGFFSKPFGHRRMLIWDNLSLMSHLCVSAFRPNRKPKLKSRNNESRVYEFAFHSLYAALLLAKFNQFWEVQTKKRNHNRISSHSYTQNGV